MVVLTAAGDLRNRVAFEKSIRVDDGGGGTSSGWAEQFSAAAGIVYLKGTEPIVAQRLQGVQPAVITVRGDSRTRLVTTDWRARDARTGTLFEIKAVTPDGRGRFIDILVETS